VVVGNYPQAVFLSCFVDGFAEGLAMKSKVFVCILAACLFYLVSTSVPVGVFALILRTGSYISLALAVLVVLIGSTVAEEVRRSAGVHTPLSKDA
jgi:hypothetical protein